MTEQAENQENTSTEPEKITPPPHAKVLERPAIPPTSQQEENQNEVAEDPEITLFASKLNVIKHSLTQLDEYISECESGETENGKFQGIVLERSELLELKEALTMGYNYASLLLNVKKRLSSLKNQTEVHSEKMAENLKKGLDMVHKAIPNIKLS